MCRPTQEGSLITWFKVDDKFWSHRKARALPAEAIALWVRAGSYAGDHLTDGVITHDDLAFLGGSEKAAHALVRAGLWDDIEDGYAFHDWEHYQPTKAKIESERVATRERVKQWREAKKNDTTSIPVPSRPSYAVSNGVSNTVTGPTRQPGDRPVADVLADLERKCAE